MVTKCFFCSEPAKPVERLPMASDIYCTDCGLYFLDPSGMKAAKDCKGLIAGYLFATKDTRSGHYVIDNEEVEAILASPLTPKTLTERIVKVLTYIDSNTTYLGEEVSVPIAAAYASDARERNNLFDSLAAEGLIGRGGSGPYVKLKLLALKFIREQSIEIRSGQCFVAMWFNDEMNRFFEEIIKPSCREVGYEAIRVSDRQFVDYITDEIIAGIRESAFLIADYTGQRGGVYYEAGYAMGLGKTVIQMCREDEKDKMHFDIRQRNTILWEFEKMEEAKEMLKNRIRATVGKGIAL